MATHVNQNMNIFRILFHGITIKYPYDRMQCLSHGTEKRIGIEEKLQVGRCI